MPFRAGLLRGALERKTLILIVKACIAVFLVWYLFNSGNLSKETFIKIAKPSSLTYLLMSCIAFCAAQTLSSIRLLYLLRIIEIKINIFQSFKLTMIGNFFNLVIPGAVGGDVIKGYYLAKTEFEQKGRSAGILITDRILGLMALLIISCISLLYLFKTSSFIFKISQSTISALLATGLTICLLFIAFVFISKHKAIRDRIKKLALMIFKEGFVYFIIEGLGSVTKKRRYLFIGVIISVFIQLICLYGIIVLTGITDSADKNAVALMAVSSVVMLSGVVPVSPGNIGWTELMATYGWSAVGGSGGAEVFLFWRIVTMICSLPGAIFYLYQGKKPDDNKTS